MNKFAITLIFTILLSSCYTYRVYEPDNETENRKSTQANSRLSTFRMSEEQIQQIQKAKELEESQTLVEVKPKTVIKEKEFYQIKVLDKETKIEAVKWQGDTLVAQVKGQPKNILKVHEKDIEDFKVRKFSKSRSDAMTIAAYATAGLGLFLLLK